MVGLLALVMLGCLAHQAAALDGGSHCKYIDRRELELKLKDQNGSPQGQGIYFNTLSQLGKTNNWVCKACGPGTEKITSTAVSAIGTQVAPGYGQCICKAGYGSWSYAIGRTSTTTPLVVAKPGKTLQGLGCSKCPNGVRGLNMYDGTTVSTNDGPYNPSANTWTGTKCTCKVTATGAAC